MEQVLSLERGMTAHPQEVVKVRQNVLLAKRVPIRMAPFSRNRGRVGTTGDAFVHKYLSYPRYLKAPWNLT